MKIIRMEEGRFVPSSHEPLERPGVTKQILFAENEFPNKKIQMLQWGRIEPGMKFASHSHVSMDEIFIVTSGTVRACIDDNTMALNSGDVLLVNAGESHSMKNETYSDVLMVVLGLVDRDSSV